MRGRLLVFSLMLGAVALLAAAASVGSRAPHVHALGDCTVGSFGLDSTEMAFLSLLNDYRQQNGRSPLETTPALNKAAHWMANDLGANGYFAHTDSLGRNPSTRAADCGYPHGVGENIAAGGGLDAQAVFNVWKNSSGHNANMLGSGYQVIGIARVNVPGSPYGTYWVTKFGSVVPTTSPTNTPTQATTSTPTQPPPATATPTASPTPTQPAPATPTFTPTSLPTSTPTATPTSVAPASTPTSTPTQPSGAPSSTPTPHPTPPLPGLPSPTSTAHPTPPMPVLPTATPTSSPGSVPLVPGVNLIGWTGPSGSANQAFDTLPPSVTAVYGWSSASQSWLRYIPDGPDWVNNLRVAQQGSAYWVVVR